MSDYSSPEGSSDSSSDDEILGRLYPSSHSRKDVRRKKDDYHEEDIVDDVRNRDSHYFPVDCVCHVVSFFKNCKTFLNVLLVSKDVKRYIESHHYVCRHILFYYRSEPISPTIPYCLSLKVWGLKDDFENQTIQYFPNLTKLQIREVESVDSDIFKYVSPKLRKLKLEDCRRIFKDLNFHSIGYELQSLTLHGNRARYTISSSIFLVLEKVEKLDLYNISIRTIVERSMIPLNRRGAYGTHHNRKRVTRREEDGDFRKIRNLKKLSLYKVDGITSEIFEFFGHTLESLDFIEMEREFGIQGFRHLKKVDDLYICDCGVGKGIIINLMGRTPKIFDRQGY